MSFLRDLPQTNDLELFWELVSLNDKRLEVQSQLTVCCSPPFPGGAEGPRCVVDELAEARLTLEMPVLGLPGRVAC